MSFEEESQAHLLTASEYNVRRPSLSHANLRCMNGYTFFRRDPIKETRDSGIEIVSSTAEKQSVYGLCVAAAADAPVKVGQRAIIAFRNVREMRIGGEVLCVIKSDEIMAICEDSAHVD